MVVSDGSLTDTKTFTLTVNPIDDNPSISTQLLGLSFLEDGLAQDLIVSISDPDDATSSCSELTGSSISDLVSIIFIGTTSPCTARITPKANKFGTDTVVLTFNNGKAVSTNVSINITSQPDKPTITISQTSLSFFEDGDAKTVTVTIADVDVETPVSCNRVSLTTGNNVGVNMGGTAPNCVATIKPLKDKDKNETIKLTVNNGLTAEASLDIIITPVDDAPTISVSPTNLALTYNGSGQSVIADLKDIDSQVDCATQISVSQSSYVTVSQSVCTFTITPNPNTVGSGALFFSVPGPNGLPISATINFSIAPLPPRVTYSSTSAKVGTTLTIPAAIDPRGSGTVTCVPKPLLQGLSVQSNCSISGTPLVTANSSYTIDVNSSAGLSSTASVSITINANLPQISISPSSSTATVQTYFEVKPIVTANGAPTTCTISPQLSSGLIFNSSTCAITGTPTVAAARATYTVTAKNSAGDSNPPAQVTITVIPGKPVLSYSGSLTGTVGDNLFIPPSTLDTKGGALTDCTISPGLPSNLQIDRANCRISGIAQTAIKGTYYVTATNLGGSSAPAALYIGITQPSYNCRDNGFTGPYGTVSSVSECYMDCDSISKCGGTTYGHNGCYHYSSRYLGDYCYDQISYYTREYVCWNVDEKYCWEEDLETCTTKDVKTCTTNNNESCTTTYSCPQAQETRIASWVESGEISCDYSMSQSGENCEETGSASINCWNGADTGPCGANQQMLAIITYQYNMYTCKGRGSFAAIADKNCTTTPEDICTTTPQTTCTTSRVTKCGTRPKQVCEWRDKAVWERVCYSDYEYYCQ